MGVRAVCSLYHVVSRSWGVYPLSCLTGPSLALVAGLEPSVYQVVLKLTAILAQPPKIWDYRHALPTPGLVCVFVILLLLLLCVLDDGGCGSGDNFRCVGSTLLETGFLCCFASCSSSCPLGCGNSPVSAFHLEIGVLLLLFFFWHLLHSLTNQEALEISLSLPS